jgi:DNA segregation ATPase FtsK/SpoIIIE-like protein
MDASRSADVAPDPHTRAGRGRSKAGSLAAAFGRATLVPFLVGGAAGAVAEAALSLVLPRQPGSLVLVAVPVLAISYAVVATGVFALALRSLVREALEGFSWQGRWEWLRWRERVGRNIPTTQQGMERWLDETRDRSDLDLERIELLVFVRRFDEASVHAERLPQETPWQRFERAVLADWIEFVQTGRTDVDGLRRLAGDVVDPDEAVHADAMIAVAEARRLLAFGRATDWLRPLAELRRRLGRRADDILRREFLPARFKAYLVVGSVLALLMRVWLPS